jgi:hypothetical protein
MISILLIIIFIFLITNKNFESFKNIYDKDEDINIKNYLYPVKGLQSQCEEEDLYPSFMPKICTINGKMNTYANCKCEDERGECKICYPTIENHKSGAQVIFSSKF